MFSRVKLVEKEKDELEGPMKEALNCIRMENERVHKKNKRIQLGMLQCKKQIGLVPLNKFPFLFEMKCFLIMRIPPKKELLPYSYKPSCG